MHYVRDEITEVLSRVPEVKWDRLVDLGERICVYGWLPKHPTAEEIVAAQSPAGGWPRDQLAEWNVPWPPPKGWRQRLEAEAGRADFVLIDFWLGKQGRLCWEVVTSATDEPPDFWDRLEVPADVRTTCQRVEHVFPHAPSAIRLDPAVEQPLAAPSGVE